MMNTREINIQPGKTENNELWVGITARALIFLGDYLIRKHIEGKKNLKEAANYVNTGKGGLIVVPNHNSYIDAQLMKEVRDEIDPAKRFLVLWANKFTGKDQGKYSGTGKEDPKKVTLAGKIGKRAAEMVGIELVDVPQEAKDPGVAKRAIRLIRDTGRETLGNNNVLGVFPEGTRSRDGNLGEAKRGVTVLFTDQQINSKTLILPIAATGTGEYLPPDSEKPNPLAKVSIKYGKPFTYAQAQEEMSMYNLPLETIIMWHVGQLLPEEKWGAYRKIFMEIRALQKNEKKT